MKKILILFLAGFVVLLTACHKEEIVPLKEGTNRTTTTHGNGDVEKSNDGTGVVPGGTNSSDPRGGGEVTDPNDDSILRKPRKPTN